MWLGRTKVELSPDEALKFLENPEMYAIKCSNTTYRHLSEIEQLETTEELLEYNITEGYPEPVVLEV